MTPRLILIAEGQSDISLIRKLISHELTSDMRFFASQGRASLLSTARNLIVHEGGPVLLVMDTDSTNPHVKREIEAMTTAAMSGAASGGAFFTVPGRFKVFMFVPEIEAVFFESPGALERVAGNPVSKELVEEGLMAPAATLAKITRGCSKALAVDHVVRSLDEEGIEMLRRGKQAIALRNTVEALLRDAAAA